MTTEEAISHLKNMAAHSYPNEEYLIAIKALEQQPCEDCISREAVIQIIENKLNPCTDMFKCLEMSEIKEDVEHLPLATPQPKIGHWITEAQTYYEELKKRGLGVDEYTPYFTDDIACSECLAKYSTLDNETQFFKHCPNCGAKMTESENKE